RIQGRTTDIGGHGNFHHYMQRVPDGCYTAQNNVMRSLTTDTTPTTILSDLLPAQGTSRRPRCAAVASVRPAATHPPSSSTTPARKPSNRSPTYSPCPAARSTATSTGTTRDTSPTLRLAVET